MKPKTSRDICIVIMGASVTKGGVPSGAMRRRVHGAVQAQPSLEGKVYFIPTGGVGRYGPSEAQVMRTLLEEADIPPDRIILEDQAHDTLSSVGNCAAIISKINPYTLVLIASDRYHVMRCAILFRLYGLDAHSLRIESGRAANGMLRWSYYYFREAVAIPFDIGIVLFKKMCRHNT